MQNFTLQIQDDFVPSFMDFLRSLPKQAVELQRAKKEAIAEQAVISDNFDYKLSDSLTDVCIEIDPEIAQFAGIVKLPSAGQTRNLMDFDTATTLESNTNGKAYV